MTWCPCGQPVDPGDVETIGTTRVHTVAPWHRLVDGAAILMDGGDPQVDDRGDPLVEDTWYDAAEEE